jgi:hypothetical protein
MGVKNSIRMGSRAFEVLVHERTRECIRTDDYGLGNLIETALQRGVWFLHSDHGKVCIENAIWFPNLFGELSHSFEI